VSDEIDTAIKLAESLGPAEKYLFAFQQKQLAELELTIARFNNCITSGRKPADDSNVIMAKSKERLELAVEQWSMLLASYRVEGID